MLLRHRGDDRLLVFEVAINEADADPSFRAQIVHGRLMKAALGEADHGGAQDLLAAIGSVVSWRRHAGDTNE